MGKKYLRSFCLKTKTENSEKKIYIYLMYEIFFFLLEMGHTTKLVFMLCIWHKLI